MTLKTHGIEFTQDGPVWSWTREDCKFTAHVYPNDSRDDPHRIMWGCGDSWRFVVLDAEFAAERHRSGFHASAEEAARYAAAYLRLQGLV